MKFLAIAICSIVAGYNGGMAFDVYADSGEPGKFDKQMIPFGIGNAIAETQNFLFTYPFEGGPYIFQNAFLADTEVFDHAFVDFVRTFVQNPDGTLSDRVTECVFRADVDVNTECVVCILRDGAGNNIAKGEQFFNPPYAANTKLTLEVTKFLNDDPSVIDVQNVKGVQIGMCEENPQSVKGEESK